MDLDHRQEAANDLQSSHLINPQTKRKPCSQCSKACEMSSCVSRGGRQRSSRSPRLNLNASNGPLFDGSEQVRMDDSTNPVPPGGADSTYDTNDVKSNTWPAFLPTEKAAPLINRKPQTLRKWACQEKGPIQPIRINGRLAWRVTDLRALLEGEGG